MTALATVTAGGAGHWQHPVISQPPSVVLLRRVFEPPWSTGSSGVWNFRGAEAENWPRAPFSFASTTPQPRSPQPSTMLGKLGLGLAWGRSGTESGRREIWVLGRLSSVFQSHRRGLALCMCIHACVHTPVCMGILF